MKAHMQLRIGIRYSYCRCAKFQFSTTGIIGRSLRSKSVFLCHSVAKTIG